MKEIVIASKNKGKIAEIEKYFADLPVKVISLAAFPDVEDAVEDGDTFEANSLIKARFYAMRTGKACLADDSGLEVAALGYAPGVYSARFAGEDATDAANNHKLLTLLKEFPEDKRAARFRCALTFLDTDGTVLACDGSCEGQIAFAPSGNGGFGYDPLFYLPHWEKTMAELSVEEKNKISHRGKALKKMAEKLAGYFA